MELSKTMLGGIVATTVIAAYALYRRYDSTRGGTDQQDGTERDGEATPRGPHAESARQ